jgi:hypothetical protein
VAGVVHRKHTDGGPFELDDTDGARVLRDPPIGGQRLVEQLEEERSIDAFVANEHDRAVRKAVDNPAERVGRSQHNVLQRFAVGKANELRRGKPLRVEPRPFFFDFLERLPLTVAVVEIVEVSYRDRIDSARSP